MPSAASSQLARPRCVVAPRCLPRCRAWQARIALVNTALTAAGMWALAIPGIGLLSLFVFVCSFIPIAGCIISTVPIGFVALTGEAWAPQWY
jgi:predicted PurR-regulated permease PerM